MSQIKYKCLMIDHDDTAVDSSREIHYPCFVKTVETFRPGEYILTLEEFMNACFYPGLYDYYTRILGFTKEELDLELEMWQNYVKERVPHFYEGIGEILSDFRASGGVIAVSSQSHRDVILRDYTARLGFVFFFKLLIYYFLFVIFHVCIYMYVCMNLFIYFFVLFYIYIYIYIFVQFSLTSFSLLVSLISLPPANTIS
jgi:hypothetical protein